MSNVCRLVGVVVVLGILMFLATPNLDAATCATSCDTVCKAAAETKAPKVVFRRGVFMRGVPRHTAACHCPCECARSTIPYEFRQSEFKIVEEQKTPFVRRGMFGAGILADRVIVPRRTELKIETSP